MPRDAWKQRVRDVVKVAWWTFSRACITAMRARRRGRRRSTVISLTNVPKTSLYCRLCWIEVWAKKEMPKFCPKCEKETTWTEMIPHAPRSKMFSLYDVNFLKGLKISRD